MADFKAALEALAQGKIKPKTLSNQLKKLLEQSPGVANKLLAQIDQYHAKKFINDAQYAELKRQINHFRRTHQTETEASAGGGDATVFDQGDDQSQSSGVPSEEDLATEINEKTRIVDEDEKEETFGTDPGSKTVDFDLSMAGMDVSSPSATSGTGPVSSEWTDPAAISGDDATGEYHEGSVIKQRFKLEKVLGIGGMGKVYKALDLLKYEARDKRPYVAVKLLNEDFKQHPEAFISLQRESSRQQKLAHPNIATIYDFDRVGGPGTPVFITMELMEGMELKDYIKKNVISRNGLPFNEANDIIKQLGAGLIYAHERRLVHSDFKPGNAFYCNDGTVKTLDFGIARAVKNPLTGEAEKTLFDAGKLGALTPAYASLEMLAGQEPDTRDDTYALGCTSYELLTGKHPFNKAPADKAKKNNLVPPYIKSLNKKQNRALRRAVAFDRKDRSPTVAHFLDELEGKATWHKNPFVIAAAVVVGIGLMLINPALDYLHNEKLQAMVAEINNGDQATIVAKMAEIRQLEPADKTTVTDQAKDILQNYFKNKIAATIDTSGEDYDFKAAASTLKNIEEFYPESIFLQEQEGLINSTKKQFISLLNIEYVTALKDKSLIDNTKEILDKVARVDANHPLLEDPRPSVAYRELAREAFENNDFDLALGLAESGMETAPDDQRLIDLRSSIQRAQKVGELEQALSAVKGQLTSLPDFQQHSAAIAELSSLNPEGALITELSATAKLLVNEDLKSILATGAREDAESMAADYGELLNALALNVELTELKLAHLSGDERSGAIQEISNQDIDEIQQSLTEPNIEDASWESKLLANVQELGSLAKERPSINETLNDFRRQIAGLYITKANEVLDRKRFDLADSLINRGETFSPGLQDLFDVRNAVASARAEDARQERIRSNKADLKTFTDGDNVTEAVQAYAQLKADLPEDDIFLTTEAATMMSGSYARLAKSRGEAKDFKSAFALAKRGVEIDPNNSTLQSLSNEYEAEANIIELIALFSNNSVLSFPNNVRIKVDQIQNFAAPGRSAEFSKQAIQSLSEKINALRGPNETAAAAIAQSASAMFPSSSILAKLKTELQLQPWDQFTSVNTLVSVGKLSEAQQIQQAAATEFAGHPQFVSFSENLAQKIIEANSIFDIFVEDRNAAGENHAGLVRTKNLLARAQQLWTDNPDFAAAEQGLNDRIAQYKPKPKIRKAEEELTVAAITDDAGTTAQKVEWKPIPSDSDCTTRLAGYGRRAKAICYDMIHTQARGPLMVVVPTGENIGNHFAIGKYEISVGDWSKYCILSGNCKAIKERDKSEPMTGISLADVQTYTNWLSERTGKTYRLPSKEEWEYAANSGGQQPKKDFNCRVAVGDKIIKGNGTISIKSGKSNQWGLKNYIGNVQEWVLDGSSAFARGGAFSDAHSKCDISLERSHNGAPDETTGFRLLREEIG